MGVVARHKSTGDMLETTTTTTKNYDDKQMRAKKRHKQIDDCCYSSSGQLSSNVYYAKLNQRDDYEDQQREDQKKQQTHVEGKINAPLLFGLADEELINRWNSCGRLLASSGRTQSFWWDEKDTRIEVDVDDEKDYKDDDDEEPAMRDVVGIPHVIIKRRDKSDGVGGVGEKKKKGGRGEERPRKKQQVALANWRRSKANSSPLLLPLDEIETKQQHRTAIGGQVGAKSVGVGRDESWRTEKASCDLLDCSRRLSGREVAATVSRGRRRRSKSKSKSMLLPLKRQRHLSRPFQPDSPLSGNNLRAGEGHFMSRLGSTDSLREKDNFESRKSDRTGKHEDGGGGGEYEVAELRLQMTDDGEDEDDDVEEGLTGGIVSLVASPELRRRHKRQTTEASKKTMRRTDDGQVHLLDGGDAYGRNADDEDDAGHSPRQSDGNLRLDVAPRQLQQQQQQQQLASKVLAVEDVRRASLGSQRNEPPASAASLDVSRLCPHRRNSSSSSSSSPIGHLQPEDSFAAASTGSAQANEYSTSQYLHPHLSEGNRQEEEALARRQEAKSEPIVSSKIEREREFELRQVVVVVVPANEQAAGKQMVDLVGGAKSKLQGACQQVAASSAKLHQSLVSQMAAHSATYKVAQVQQRASDSINNSTTNNNNNLILSGAAGKPRTPDIVEQVTETGTATTTTTSTGQEVWSYEGGGGLAGGKRRLAASRLSRPGRSPVSLQRQTNARLTRHRLKIQQQRQEQLAQLALRERQQLIAITSNSNNNSRRQQQQPHQTLISTISSNQSRSLNNNDSNRNNSIDSSQQIEIEILDDINREENNVTNNNNNNNNNRRRPSFLANLRSYLPARFISRNQFSVTHQDNNNTNDRNNDNNNNNQQHRFALAEFGGRLNEVISNTARNSGDIDEHAGSSGLGNPHWRPASSGRPREGPRRKTRAQNNNINNNNYSTNIHLAGNNYTNNSRPIVCKQSAGDMMYRTLGHNQSNPMDNNNFHCLQSAAADSTSDEFDDVDDHHHHRYNSDNNHHQMDDTKTICSTSSSSSTATSINSNKPFCKICHLGNYSSGLSNSDSNIYAGHLKNGQHDKLISPCKCSGTMQYIHCGCLLKWLEISNRTTDKPMSCELCSHEYTWHKRFNYRQLKLPKCSLKDMFLHLIFIMAISLMLFCAVAPIIGRNKLISNAVVDNPSMSSPSLDINHQTARGGAASLPASSSSSSISFSNHQMNDPGPPSGGRDTNHLSSSSSYRRTFTGYSTANQFTSNSGRLASDEKFVLSCAAFFFVSFFLAIYVQTKTKDTLYGLFVKFMDINQTYYITEYDHGGGATGSGAGAAAPGAQDNNNWHDKLGNNVQNNNHNNNNNHRHLNDSNLIGDNNNSNSNQHQQSASSDGQAGRCIARLERSQSNGRKK